jgi:3-oxoacyl-[acyl-carrier protein] reductase
MSNKVALITGSTSGIGRAIALKLAQDGFSIVLHGGQNSEKLAQTLGEFKKRGVDSTGFLVDFAETDQIPKLVQQSWDWKNRIDVLINNAGVDLLTKNVAIDVREKLQQLWQIDVAATLHLSNLIGERMRALAQTAAGPAGQFSICNIGWDQADQGMAGESGVLFSTSKGAIMSMTRSLAQSFAPEVRINCVAPGWIKTSWGDSASASWQRRAKNESLMARWGTPEDVANAVAFLSSDEANFISGQILAVNGGFRFATEDL